MVTSGRGLADVATPAAGSPAPVASPPDTPAPAAVRLTLRQCLELADKNHPNILSAQARAAYMKAQTSEAHTAPYSSFTLTTGVGPAPTFRGGQIYTQDTSVVGLSSSFGLAWQAGITGTVPIWTFGKITNLWKAAEAQVRVGEADAEKARNAVRLDVRRAYYGYLLATEALTLLDEAGGRLEQAVVPLKKKVDAGDADDADLIQLQLAQVELETRRAEATRGQQVARAALRFYTGVDRLEIQSAGLQAPKHGLTPLGDYLDAARSHRPEMRMALAGLEARTAQVDLARAKMMPDIGLTLFANYTRAPEITQQLNPFTNYNANSLTYGFALGMRWSLDFLPASARVRQAEAQLGEVRQSLRLALGGIATEVEKAYAEASEMKKKSEAYQRAQKLARQWMIRVAQGLDVGTSEEKDLIPPARQYAQQRYNYLSALMDYNLAMANLALATGWDVVAEPVD